MIVKPYSDKAFFAIGVSYEKADAETRGKFTFFPESVPDFVREAKEIGIDNFFIVSTCNRSEFYGFSENPETMMELYCKHSKGTMEEMKEVVSIKKNDEAIHHLFQVAAGLKSQILGDFEIISQIKIWFKRFKKQGSSGAFLERLINTAIQISKKIKTETTLSNGAASVSFAAVHYIMATEPAVSEKNILLYGIGKIGRNTCTNLIKHTQNDHITLINRSREKAELMTEKYDVLVKDHTELIDQLKSTDILIVATGAESPTITEEMIPYDKEMTIIDLSVPENVMHTLGSRENIQLINVDGLSKMVDDTIGSRKDAIPAAQEIIETCKTEFDEWLKTREYVPVIQSFKERLEFLQAFETKNLKKKNPQINGKETLIAEKLVQNLTNQFASYLLENRENAGETIAMMEEIFRLKQINE
ncbi:glutamyl-tRNA reductase [Moheibacter lacus]|uniref:Glutamyl-tRNA reductase n=1 Tax=Moheibacter lacus TaxID=2745851 RepID=A0A838ZR42_9FLAO|nr:glutamyl-tRNA reductase [Moheibacter lacus]MBA5628543.1 glutamyl-tRNA reductase [Moheibacter lacus]